ncbi:MAG: hypothetical protein F6K40_02575 [Okeania sp. SIO3I5]|uniref:hypothetical protein n=1 Tax=Okeania sp. SIO3I5 TaxID=2607805 RepID=UPI0013B95ECE|nr:hypothetical protein [Okeania sp. SIO3I5]NEQ35250.1 hypothetical protein [Okeania sp. SIO3I5]
MNLKPVFANRITEADYDRLKIGMTYQEVKGILGREGEIYTEYNSPNLEKFSVAYRWVNNNGTGIIAVFNSENKLIKLNAQNLNANNLGINRESPVVTSLNFENIKVGMTYDEVRKIIGSGGTKQPTRDNPLTNSNTTEYIWLNPDGTSMTIIFDSNQKVVTIRTQNMNTYNFGNPFWNQPKPVYSITQEKYEKLQLGMTYQEIRNILRKEGELDTEFDPETFEKSREAREMQINANAYQRGLVDREQVVPDEPEEGDKIKDAYKWMNPDETGIKVVFNMQDRAVAIYTFGLGVGVR